MSSFMHVNDKEKQTLSISERQDLETNPMSDANNSKNNNNNNNDDPNFQPCKVHNFSSPTVTKTTMTTTTTTTTTNTTTSATATIDWKKDVPDDAEDKNIHNDNDDDDDNNNNNNTTLTRPEIPTGDQLMSAIKGTNNDSRGDLDETTMKLIIQQQQRIKDLEIVILQSQEEIRQLKIQVIDVQKKAILVDKTEPKIKDIMAEASCSPPPKQPSPKMNNINSILDMALPPSKPSANTNTFNIAAKVNNKNQLASNRTSAPLIKSVPANTASQQQQRQPSSKISTEKMMMKTKKDASFSSPPAAMTSINRIGLTQPPSSTVLTKIINLSPSPISLNKSTPPQTTTATATLIDANSRIVSGPVLSNIGQRTVPTPMNPVKHDNSNTRPTSALLPGAKSVGIGSALQNKNESSIKQISLSKVPLDAKTNTLTATATTTATAPSKSSSPSNINMKDSTQSQAQDLAKHAATVTPKKQSSATIKNSEESTMSHIQRDSSNTHKKKKKNEKFMTASGPIGLRENPNQPEEKRNGLEAAGARGLALGEKKTSRYWSQAEHELFLRGLEKYGPKDIKEIAKLVKTRTPTQVRTHAQKYFLRLEREGTKARASATLPLSSSEFKASAPLDTEKKPRPLSLPPDSPSKISNLPPNPPKRSKDSPLDKKPVWPANAPIIVNNKTSQASTKRDALLWRKDSRVADQSVAGHQQQQQPKVMRKIVKSSPSKRSKSENSMTETPPAVIAAKTRKFEPLSIERKAEFVKKPKNVDQIMLSPVKNDYSEYSAVPSPFTEPELHHMGPPTSEKLLGRKDSYHAAMSMLTNRPGDTKDQFLISGDHTENNLELFDATVTMEVDAHQDMHNWGVSYDELTALPTKFEDDDNAAELISSIFDEDKRS